jgi:outer membrane protein
LHKIPGMKNGLLILNGLLLLAVAILFYLHFSSGRTNTKDPDNSKLKEATLHDTTKGGRIAYLDIDSIESNLEIVKIVRKELDKKKDSINEILAGIEKSIRNKANEYQSKLATMNESQQEMARNDINQRQSDFETTKQQYNQFYMDAYNVKDQQIRGEIEDFLKLYNKDRKFTFILAYDPRIIYYKDTMYNITTDVIKGVNEMYWKKKK